MTPLRRNMIEAMRVRGFAVRTHKSYLSAVSELARYYWRSPDALDVYELQAFFVYLATERGLSGASCRLYLNAIRFIDGERYAYATHQLQAGLLIHQLQRLLGHQNIQSTLRYVHWVPNYREGTNAADLVAELEVDHE